jgi:hypothetical protein
MKHFYRQSYHSFFLIIVCLVSWACSSDTIESDGPVLSLEKFSLLKSLNPTIEEDVICPVAMNDTSIVMYAHHLYNFKNLIPSIDGVYDKITIDGVEIKSGISPIDLSEPRKMELTKGNVAKKYTVSITGHNGLPVMNIETDNGVSVSSKTDYVDATISLCNYGCKTWKARGQIRGRGNVTWRNFPKKPYKIKFSQAESPFGFAQEKDWVLLADYTDKSLLRTPYMSEISKAVGLKYTVNYKHIELFLNDEYLGTYLLTDQVEKSKSRIIIDNSGFIIEDDTYFYNEPYYFKTVLNGCNYTFKYPDVSTKDESASFIEDYMNNLEAQLAVLVENPSDLGYMDFIDIDSFAKWFIVAELTGNLDPNLYYVLFSRTEKLLMMPMWDAEWSLGLACKGNPDEFYGWYLNGQHGPMLPTDEYWKNQLYFKNLFFSPTFVECVKKQWSDVKPNIMEAIKFLKQYRYTINDSQEDNFTKWPILDQYLGGTLIVCGGWSKEVDYIEKWIEDRVMWFDEYVKHDFIILN